MKKDDRQRIPSVIKKKMRIFYEGHLERKLKCVIRQGELITYHHLDENPSNSKIEQNIIPLEGTLNNNIEHRESQGLLPELQPESLKQKAQIYYLDGNFSYGYGCSILGAHLAKNPPFNPKYKKFFHPNAEDVIFFSASALINLRPLDRQDYATYVLDKIVYPILHQYGKNVSKLALSKLSMEIGSYFRDSGQPISAQSFLLLASQFLKNETKSSVVNVLKTRITQHDGIAEITKGNITSAIKLLKKSYEEIIPEYRIGYANNALYSTSIELRKQNPNFDYIEESYRGIKYGNRNQVTLWTEIELRLKEIEAVFAKNNKNSKKKAFDLIEDFLLETAQKRIKPTNAVLSSALLLFEQEFPDYTVRPAPRLILRLEELKRKPLTSEFIFSSNAIKRLLESLS